MNDPVRVSFDYTPDDPDPDDPTGLSADEHDRVTETLMEELGAMDIRVEKKS